MAAITVADVRKIYRTQTVDDIIQAYIDAVEDKMGACVDGSQPESIAKLIKTNMTAYLLSVADGVQEVSSHRAPNGASVTYSTGVTSEGIRSNQYGKTVFMLDTAKCWRAFVPSTAFMVAAGINATSKFSR